MSSSSWEKCQKSKYMMEENIHNSYDKELISKIYKVLTKLNNKKVNNLIKKWEEKMRRDK